jgi:clan AA aspartic protease
MNGRVDANGRALIALRLRSRSNSTPTDLTIWIDTAFTGDLVIPRSTIHRLQLPRSASVAAGLADGREVLLDSYHCIVDWFGKEVTAEVIENDGQFPLLGIGLLRGRRLEVDYRSSSLTID